MELLLYFGWNDLEYNKIWSFINFRVNDGSENFELFLASFCYIKVRVRRVECVSWKCVYNLILYNF